MCGIAGIVRISDSAPIPEREALLRMAGALRHRGPDEFGLYRDYDAGLAHARLSIVDLASGQQPLTNEDGTLVISFNGEIYNYIELREELLAAGHRFRTKSDTEVIVHAYEQWGDNSFGRMSGQWAVALWNSRSRTLVLSRDRFGVRPLHIAEHGGRVYFASEAKAIFAADRAISRELDPLGLEQTFAFWTVLAPRTIFRAIEELPAGTTRVYGQGRCRQHVYWRPQFPHVHEPGRTFTGSIEEASHAVRHALERATSLRMLRADVPVGSYLSGGLDSSFIAALGRTYAGERLKTFSVRFTDAEYDEHAFQRIMVDVLGSEHAEIAVSRGDIARAFPAVIVHTERPVLRTAAAPLYLLSKLVRERGIKVVLTGEGADEVFGGYELFREGKIRRFWARQPQSRLRPQLLARLYPYLARSPTALAAIAHQFFGQNLERANRPGFAHELRWNGTQALRRLLSADIRREVAACDVVADFLASLPRDFAEYSPLAQDQIIEMQTLLSGYLLSSQGDRMLMAHSVEGRFPFLDRDVVALAASLPAEHKLFGLREKHVLKKAAEGLVPRAILKRPKQPYRAPDALAFTDAGAPDYVSELLSSAAIVKNRIFDEKATERLWQKATGHKSQFSNADNMALVGILSTQLVCELFVNATPSAGEVSLRTDLDCVRSQ